MRRPLPSFTPLLIGLLLVTFGMLLAWLLVLHVLPSTILLNFLSYLCSMAGVLLGVIGTAQYVRLHRKK